jgi:hypothetical protein
LLSISKPYSFLGNFPNVMPVRRGGMEEREEE